MEARAAVLLLLQIALAMTSRQSSAASTSQHRTMVRVERLASRLSSIVRKLTAGCASGECCGAVGPRQGAG
jgi:hypothetical protein